MTFDRYRPSWDEYFLMLAKLAATRSTCLAFPVGAVIVKNKQLLATGYNGPPAKSAHCLDLGYCYIGLDSCDASKAMPSRAIHAEANAIAQAAKNGIETDGANIYVTLEPCLSCLKLIISAGIREVFYEAPSTHIENARVRDIFVAESLITLKQVRLSETAAKMASLSLLKQTSVKE